VDDAAVEPGVVGRHAQQGFGEWVLHQDHAEVRDHLGRGVEPVEHAQQARRGRRAGPAIAASLGDGNRWISGQRIEVSGEIQL
jgi:hypothetical protein